MAGSKKPTKKKHGAAVFGNGTKPEIVYEYRNGNMGLHLHGNGFKFKQLKRNKIYGPNSIKNSSIGYNNPDPDYEPQIIISSINHTAEKLKPKVASKYSKEAFFNLTMAPGMNATNFEHQRQIMEAQNQQNREETELAVGGKRSENVVKKVLIPRVFKVFEIYDKDIIPENKTGGHYFCNKCETA